MERVEVTVRGEHTAYLPPERATVHVEIALEGPTAQTVYDGAVASSRTVAEAVQRLHDPQAGPVTWWASDQVRTWSRRPWNQDGKLLPPVHHARMTLQAKFRDFGRLGAWLGEMAPVSGFSLHRIDWALTADHRTAVTHEVRQRAVRQAREKAQAYADALDLGPLHPVALADAGMLGEGLDPRGETAMAYTRAVKGGGAEVEFVPQDIAVSASIDARFAVS